MHPNELNNVEPDRRDIVVLGRKLGTFNGWDQTDDFGLVFYSIIIPGRSAGDLNVNYDAGTYELVNPDGKSVEAGDLVDLVRDFPKLEVEGKSEGEG